MRLPLVLLMALAACTQFPELDGTFDPDAAGTTPPALVPLEPILARASSANTAAEISIATFDGRISNLHNRATALRGPVIDLATRSRMLRGVR